MKVSEKDYIEQSVLQNLLESYARLTASGSADEIIKMTNYLLKLAKKRKDKFLDLGLEEDEERTT